eukprot:9653670-Ditylum_brightwellii.AAC.2
MLCTANARVPPTREVTTLVYDELLAVILQRAARLEAERCSTLSPELQQMVKNTRKIFARHKTYLLQMAEEEATATFPLLLEKLLNTVPTVPPTAGADPPPFSSHPHQVCLR